MPGTATWQITGTSSDGSTVIINVTATINDDGGIDVNYALADDSAPADLIGIWFDFFNDGGNFSTNFGGGNNLNGYGGGGFDYGEAIGQAGLQDGANTEGTVTLSRAQLDAFGFDGLEGSALLEAFAETEIAFRATSTGEDGEGSLKIGDTGEYNNGDDDDDFFEEWPQDISNAVFYIDTTGDGEWDLAVKIDNFPDADKIGWISNDMDDFYACMFEYIKHTDDRVDDDSVLIGVSIKGGTSDDAFFLIEGDTNGPLPDPDDAPDPLLNTGPGTTEYQYADFYDFYLEDCVA